MKKLYHIKYKDKRNIWIVFIAKIEKLKKIDKITEIFWTHLNTAADEVPEIPFLSTFLGCAVRFDSGLRHDYEMREMLIFQCFSHFSLLNILITLDYTFIFPCSLFVAIWAGDFLLWISRIAVWKICVQSINHNCAWFWINRLLPNIM